MSENKSVLQIVEVTQLPPQIMVLFGCEHDAALDYAAKWGELVYYVPTNHSYYVIAHYEKDKVMA